MSCTFRLWVFRKPWQIWQTQPLEKRRMAHTDFPSHIYIWPWPILKDKVNIMHILTSRMVTDRRRLSLPLNLKSLTDLRLAYFAHLAYLTLVCSKGELWRWKDHALQPCLRELLQQIFYLRHHVRYVKNAIKLKCVFFRPLNVELI